MSDISTRMSDIGSRMSDINHIRRHPICILDVVYDIIAALVSFCLWRPILDYMNYLIIVINHCRSLTISYFCSKE